MCRYVNTDKIRSKSLSFWGEGHLVLSKHKISLIIHKLWNWQIKARFFLQIRYGSEGQVVKLIQSPCLPSRVDTRILPVIMIKRDWYICTLYMVQFCVTQQVHSVNGLQWLRLHVNVADLISSDLFSPVFQIWTIFGYKTSIR